MKREIANYIEKLLTIGKPLTDSQARIIAYWELVDFQCDVDEPNKQYRDVLRKFMEDYNNEVSTLV
jgi:hypothetical protein